MLLSTKMLRLALLTLALAGCTEKYLDESPRDQVTEANFYKTETDAIQATTAIYGVLTQGGLYNSALWGVGEVMSDNSDLGGGGGGDGAEYVQLDNFTIPTTNVLLSKLWTGCYVGIGRANLVLDKVPGIAGMNSATQARCLGEARFMRALYYFHLVRTFGDVPLITVPPRNLAEVNIARTTADQVYTQIETDLVAAAAALPQTMSGSDLGRATKGAALGLLAKVYLTRGKLPEAAQQARAVLALGQYQLWPSYADNFKVANENGQESLFEVQFKSGVTPWTENGLGFQGNEYFGPRGQNLTPNGGYGFNIPTRDLVLGYNAADTRLATSIWKPGDQLGTYMQPNSLPGSPNGYNCRKWFVGKTDNCCHDSPLNFSVLRLSEIYLILAEAVGPTAEGFEAVNKVRRRAFGLAISTPSANRDLDPTLGAADFKTAVIRERRYELAFENDRWFDLKRTGLLLTTMRAAGKNIQPFNVLMPIPQSERDINPNLSQNPGY
ncbi:MAG: RagB/SusD family nutrient uptake outer membrane protein [Janthinobacterium lividum]